LQVIASSRVLVEPNSCNTSVYDDLFEQFLRDEEPPPDPAP